MRMTSYAGTLIIAVLFTVTGMELPVYAAPLQKDKPGWINYKTRKARYPKSTYVFGFSSAEYLENETRQEFMDRLKGYARSRLAESIQVEIKSMTTSNMITENEVTANYFKQTTLSIAELKVNGLKTETYFDEDEEAGYVFTYAQKAAINQDYQNRIKQHISQTNQQLQSARKAAKAKDTREALKHYFKCHLKLHRIQEAQGLLMALNRWNYSNPALQTDTVKLLKARVEDGLDSIQKSETLSLEGLSYFMAHGLAVQTSLYNKPIYLAAITFEDKGVSSVFSQRLLMQLEGDLNQEGMKVTTNTRRFETRQGSHLVLEGTYWQSKDALKVIVTIKDPEKGETIASAEGKLPLQWLKENGVAYKPSNFNAIQNDLQALNTNENVSSGLHVDLSTNQGSRNPVFRQGDTLKLYVKTNKPCYLRFIYHLADGTKVLMLDNQYIDRSKVNKVYQIPDLFEIAPPYGAEILQLNAQTKPFEDLHTEPYGHYKRIMDDMQQIIANVRGFRPISDEEGQDETRVTLTTLPQGN